MFVWIVAVLLSTASPAPSAPPLREIYHTLSRPLCSSLQNRIRPALGLMIDNDATIDKSLPMFKDYIQRSAEGSDAGRDLAVMHLESLVDPLVKNTLAVQKLLEDPSVFPVQPRNDDDKRLIEIKVDMLKALATQAAALDIINGFVTTQQMGEMQHDNGGYLSSLSATGPAGQSNAATTQMLGGATPDPLGRPATFDDFALQAGLSPNQYAIDPTTIPGLAVGFNPISRLKDGVVWTQDIEKRVSVPLVHAIVDAAHRCGAQAPASPSPEP